MMYINNGSRHIIIHVLISIEKSAYTIVFDFPRDHNARDFKNEMKGFEFTSVNSIKIWRHFKNLFSWFITINDEY